MKNTQGWIPFYEIRGQCASCSHVVKDGKMAACNYAKVEFGNASACARYNYDWDDAK